MQHNVQHGTQNVAIKTDTTTMKSDTLRVET